MARMKIILHAFLLLGVLQISQTLALDTEEKTEEPEGGTDASCETILRENDSNFRKCQTAYFDREEFQNARLNSNSSFCMECFLFCRDNYFLDKCVKETISQSYPCFPKLNNIPPPFVMNLIDSFVEYTCKNDGEVMREAFGESDNDLEERLCKNKIRECHGATGLLTYFTSNATVSNTPSVEQSERGFCRAYMDDLNCAAKKVKGCSLRMESGIQKIITYVSTSTTCTELLEERQIEDANSNIPDAH